MATYSRDELVRQVLIELRVIDANEAPEAEDGRLVEQRAQQKLEELYQLGLIPFDIDGDIPARYFLPIVAIVCMACITAYPFRDQAEVAARADQADRTLWKFREGRNIPAPMQADYF